MKKAQFKGYLLEIVISYLIRNSGYKLIKSPSGDKNITIASNWLNIQWRWSKHQIDVLWELKQIPAFSFPIRLIIEAKFRGKPIWIETVRNIVWVLKDINENYISSDLKDVFSRYHYTASIFSTSWFSEPAVNMAVAHQISLVDLSDNMYDYIKTPIEEFVDTLFQMQTDIDKNTLSEISYHIYQALKLELSEDQINESMLGLVRKIKWKELIVWVIKWWLMIFPIEKDWWDIDSFIEYAIQRPTHNVRVRRETIENEKNWWIEPVEHANWNLYTLGFKLPNEIWEMLEKSNDYEISALQAKDDFMNTLTIYYRKGSQDYIFNLKYNRVHLQNVR